MSRALSTELSLSILHWPELFLCAKNRHRSSGFNDVVDLLIACRMRAMLRPVEPFYTASARVRFWYKSGYAEVTDMFRYPLLNYSTI